MVGPYRLLGRLGRGGMGQVYLGRSSGGRRVAVKVIRPELADDVEFRARFAREVAAARGVSGMFTALLLDADTEADQPWLATAYVPGPSLAEAVATDGPLPAHTVLGLAAGLAEGLQAIHQAGVVHRDLKPSNVLLAADGPRVIDFGISRAREASMLTVSGVIVGTPGFLSPEQAKGRPVGPPSDIFSLGGVLTYAATGTGPFGSGAPDAMVYRVVELEPELSEVPDELRLIIGRCLAKDPAARPTAAELLTELDHLGADIGVATPEWLPAAVADSLARYSPTDEVPAAAGPEPAADEPAAAGSDTVDVHVPTGPKPTIPPPASPSEASPSGSRRRLVLTAVAAAVLIAGLGVGASVAFSDSPHKVAGGPAPSVIASTGRASAAATRTTSPPRSASATPKHSAPPKRTATHKAAHRAATPTRTPATSSGTTPASSPATETGGTAPTQAAPTQAAPTTAGPTTQAPAPKPHPSPTPTSAAPAPQQISGESGVTFYSCSNEGSVDSIPGGSPVSFTFSNDSSADIGVYALTATGGAGGGETVGPHSSSAPGATADQAWIVENASGACLGIVRVDGSGGVTVS